MSGLAASNSMKLQGFVQVDVVDKETGKVQQTFKHNTVTDIGKLAFLATSAGMQLLNPTQIDRGALYLESPFSKVGNSYLIQDSVDLGLTLYLANTTQTLTAASKFLPITQPNGDIDPAKLVGFASFRRTPSTAKEGVVDIVQDDFLIDPTVQVQRWRFDATQANGTFNKVFIGAGIVTNPGNGFALSKGLNPDDTPAFGGVDLLESSYMRPGVTGLTSDTEILVSTLAQITNPTANAVFNFATGKLTILDNTDARYGVPLGIANAPQVFYNNHVYYCKGDWLYRYNITTKVQTSIGSCSGTLWQEANILYYHSGSYDATVYAWDMQALANGTSFSLSTQTFTTKYFRATSAAYAFFGAYVGKLTNGNFLIVPTSTSYGPINVIECTDIRNIEATIVGYRPKVRSAVEYVMGAKTINLWSGVSSDMKYSQITGLSTSDYARAAKGLKFSEQWYGNLISFVDLASPVTKADTNVIYVSYGYKFL